MISNTVTLNDLISASWNFKKLKDCRLFVGFKTPDLEEKPFRREPFFMQLAAECGNFEVLFPDVNFFASRVAAWSINRLPYWQRIYNVLAEEYKPLENYNRTDEETTHSAVDAEHKINTDTNSDTISDVAGYDSGDLVRDNAINSAGTMTEAGTNNSIENVARSLHAYGNIGVMTSQQMLQQEIDVANISMQEIIIEEFKDTFCLAVY